MSIMQQSGSKLAAPKAITRLDPALTMAIDQIRLLGYRRVLWQRRLWEETSQIPAQGLAIPHEEADIACQGLDNPADEAEFYRTEPAVRELDERIAELQGRMLQDREGPIASLIDRFGLSQEECDFLLLCAAPQFDMRLRRLYGYLHDDSAYCAPTRWLARVLFGWDLGFRLTPESPLVRWRLTYPKLNEEEPWGLMTRWQASSRIVGYLAGEAAVAPSLQTGAVWLNEAGPVAYEPNAARSLRRQLESVDDQEPQLIQLTGVEGIGRKHWAARICTEYGLRVLSLDAPLILGGTDTREQLLRAEREALLQGCVLYWDHADQVPPTVWEQAPLVAPLQLFGVEQPIVLPPRAQHREVIAFTLPTVAESLALWRQLLPKGLGDLGENALAERFTLTPAEIRKVAAKAFEGREALWDACRQLSRGRLQRLASILPCPFDWDDIVLPEDTKAHLHEIVAQAIHRREVLETWGFGEKRPLGRGVSALFAGASGTGKTMAAQVLASELGLILLRIDLASVVSKYIGETEKNLRQIFDEAERLNTVLFFDEADALFGRRTEVKDAHDRYANIEIDYLLQRMESYEGLAILATNRKSDIDPAFLRRVRFIVDFPMPGLAERTAIWRLALPERRPDGSPMIEGIDWDLLASRLDVSGASIKDIALAAAFLACADRTRIRMKHLVRAARRELMKHGRMVGRGELGEYDDA